ncbi:MAG: hypothetical protein CL812_08020 [Confluentimicrobium sp.]|nr:hypothetical protein [Actibacterium sp.]
MTHRFFTLATSIFLAFGPVAAAADVALVVGQAGTDRRGLFGGDDRPDVSRELNRAGFEVISTDTEDGADIRAGLSALLEELPDHDRVLVFLTGSFAHSEGGGSWLLSDASGGDDLAQVGGEAVALDVITEIMATRPGASVLVLGAKTAREDPGLGLEAGIGTFDIPQGVTVLRGASLAAANFTIGALLKRGQALQASVNADEAIRAEGFLPQKMAFLPAPVVSQTTPTQTRPDPGAAAQVERAVWEASRSQDTADAYRSYLSRYPQGAFAVEARRRVGEIEAEPNRQARLAEEDLKLTRDQRRQIQRQLTILQYEPRGIDGIFGPGTRGAITRFQTRNGFPQSGYLSGTQIARLALQAERRSAELEAEAERRRLAQERQDRAYWEATGSVGDEAGLRTYVKKYPDGLYASVAKKQLDIIEEEKRQEARAQDRSAWDQAEEGDNIRAYRNYLTAFPEGAFAEAAEQRINDLEAADSDETRVAQAEEEALNLNRITRTLIERRLGQLGLEPGNADGNFSEETRRAIRRFQSAREIQVTGYMNEETVVRMLSDAAGSVLR